MTPDGTTCPTCGKGTLWGGKLFGGVGQPNVVFVSTDRKVWQNQPQPVQATACDACGAVALRIGVA